MRKSVAIILGLLLSSTSLLAGQGLSSLAPSPAPAFELRDMEGETRKLSDYRGQPLIVNFWATWCPPCRAEMPAMNRAWHKIKNAGIGMIAINVGEDEDTIFAFTGDYPVDFTILLDQDSNTIEQWPIKGLPTTFVLDPEGNIIYRAIGGREWDDEALLDKVRALRKPAP